MFDEKLRELLARKNPVEARIEAGLLLWEYAPALLRVVEFAEGFAKTHPAKCDCAVCQALRSLEDAGGRG